MTRDWNGFLHGRQRRRGERRRLLLVVEEFGEGSDRKGEGKEFEEVELMNPRELRELL